MPTSKITRLDKGALCRYNKKSSSCIAKTTKYNNDLMQAQEKLEWVTPKIFEMGTEVTFGKDRFTEEEALCVTFTKKGSEISGPCGPS